MPSNKIEVCFHVCQSHTNLKPFGFLKNSCSQSWEQCFSHKPLQNGVHLNDLKHTPFELISTFPVEKAKSDLTQVIRFI